jgi:hypothetical protein
MLSEERVKICPRCKTEQPLSNFHKCKKNGIKTYCKKCVKEYNRKYENEQKRSTKRGISVSEILEEEASISHAQSLGKKILLWM